MTINDSPKIQYIFYTLLFIICFQNIVAQELYTPYRKRTKNQEEWALFLNQRKKEIIKKYEDYKHKSELKEFIEERHLVLLEKIESGHFYFDPGINEYFNNILKEIVSSNEQLQKKEIRFLISRYNWPNASYVGDGIIILNIGLIDKLTYDDEFAFVISHELAHYYLEHVDIDFIKRINHLHSKETKQQIKSIKKSKYGTYSKGVSMLKGFMYNSRKHGRGYEFQADSLGLQFLKNTHFNPLAAKDVLLLLDTIDNVMINPKLKIDSVFNFFEFPFQAAWIKENVQMFGGDVEDEEYWNVDSLKTHPDCLKRIEALGLGNYQKRNMISLPELEKIKKNVKYEMLLFENEFGDAGKCMMDALNLFLDNPTDLELINLISGTFSKIIEARKNHSVSEIMMSPGEAKDKELKKILLFLWNIRSQEMANVNYYFLKNIFTQNTVLRKNNDFVNLISNAAKECNKVADFELLKSK